MHKIKVSRNFVLINEEIKTFYEYKDTILQVSDWKNNKTHNESNFTTIFW